MTLAGLSIKRPIATAMIMVSMIFIGVLAMRTMKSELMPSMEIPVVTISTTWTGANPDDVETQITKKIEEILPNVEGIDRISTTSVYGRSSVVVRFDFGVDVNTKVTDIQREISRIANRLPDDAGTPIARRVRGSSGGAAMTVIFSGENKSELNTFLEQYLKPRLERLEGIGEVNIYGSPTKQIQVQVDTDKLAAYNLSPMELYSIINGATLTLPLGTIETGTKQFTTRYMSEPDSLADIENIVINSNGNILTLKDLADVVYTTEDVTTKGFLNGEESIVVQITKSKEGSTIDLNNGAKKALKSLQTILPAGAKYVIFSDSSEDIEQAISNVSSSALQGLILATIIMFIFLKNIRATLVASSSLPIAIIFTFAFLSLAGTSLNMISLMGLSIGVGMLTDNSVMVIDNIYRHMTELKSPVREAAELGTAEVTSSIIASSLTTMIVFVPILFIPGMAKEIFQDLAYSVIFSNIAALIVSITLIPMLSSRMLSNKMILDKEGKLFSNVREFYLKILRVSLKRRAIPIIITVIVAIYAVLGPANSFKMIFMAEQDKGKYSAIADIGKGIDVKKAEEILRLMEEKIKANEFTESYTAFIANSERISFNINIGKKNTRNKSVFDIINNMREELEVIPGLRLFLNSDHVTGGTPQREVEMIIMGPDIDELNDIGKRLLEIATTSSGIVDVRSSFDPGATEARVVLNKEKIKSYGINSSLIVQHLNYYLLGGDRGNTVTVKTGLEEIDVLVRLPKDSRNDINKVRNLNIKIADGKFIKLSEVADIIMAEGVAQITKTDRIYSITIGANDGGIGTGAIRNLFNNAYRDMKLPSSISFRWGGNAENFGNTLSQLSTGLLISLFLIYALLAAQFESLALPIIVIGSIPLAVIGAILGLYITKQTVDMMAMIGIIMLAGIVVNNAIVLIDFIKMTRERGFDRDEAILETGRIRLRPILMTTMTTVFGMIPLSLGIGEGSETYRGMAISVIFGLTVSTLLTLVLIPIFYTLFDDFARVLKYIYYKISRNGFKAKLKRRNNFM